MKNYTIIFAIIIGILLAWGGTMTYKNYIKNKRLGTLTYIVDAYKNAKPVITIIKDSVIYKDTTIYKPYPVPGKTKWRDTIIYKIAEREYDSTYNKNGIRFRYWLHTFGDLKGIKFTDFVIPKEIITYTKTVTIHDTIPKLIEKGFRWGLYTDMTLNNFKTFPGIGLGIQGVIKERMTLGIGGESNDHGLYINVRAGLVF